MKLLLYDSDSLDSVTNTLMLNASVDRIILSKTFDGSLLYIYFFVYSNLNYWPIVMYITLCESVRGKEKVQKN